MPENRQSNYDQVIENWRLKFLEMDQEELIRKFQLEADEEFLYIIYFSKRFRIDRKNGFITEDGKSPGFDTVMNIYNTRLLLFSSSSCGIGQSGGFSPGGRECILLRLLTEGRLFPGCRSFSPGKQKN
ncbi:MAG: hypothetical protein ACLURP_16950 [Ruminococcus sp.]